MALLVPSIGHRGYKPCREVKISLAAETWLLRAEMKPIGAELAALVIHRQLSELAVAECP